MKKTLIENFQYSRKELNKWFEAGLIDEKLLHPDKQTELFRHISEQKESLYRYYRDPDEEYPFSIAIPPTDKLNEMRELNVINKKTGAIVSTLQQAVRFELVDNVSLIVKKEDLKLWEKGTASIKSMTSEQIETLKKFIASQSSTSGRLTRKEIAIAIKEIEKNNSKSSSAQKYRQSGHFIDNKLRYPKKDIHVSVDRMIFTEAEERLLHALSKLLRDNSQNINPYENDYYLGNESTVKSKYGNKVVPIPVIRFKRTDLYRAYYDTSEISGAQGRFVDGLLKSFSMKKYLIKYDRIHKGPKNETLTDRIEENAALIRILNFLPNLTNEEKNKLDQGDVSIRKYKEEIIIAFSHIFIDQLSGKYIEFRDNTTSELKNAAGGFNKITTCMHKLMQWSLREISGKRYRTSINESNLIRMLELETYDKASRKKLVNKRISDAISVVKKMGIIVSATKKKTNKVYLYGSLLFLKIIINFSYLTSHNLRNTMQCLF